MKNNTNKILALKYRPKTFKELIGQDVMVETITNSIELNKLPNAYLLTGIRGVGKTTTARIIAKALNCKNGIKNLCIDDMCEPCEGITNSNHMDVLEMDAASRTGIDDIRELIDSSKYNPTSAKYKIIILDEVHMLSKQAFNGLLKTLEEPPPHLKFIFATTEVKKIPITIISRCQRFDLHRVPIKKLVKNLKFISDTEKAKISEGALLIIAKVAGGSVRDSLSLLDRVLISQKVDQKEIDEIIVRKILGIVDRTKILHLLKLIFQGEEKKSIQYLREMIKEGIEEINFLNDLLEIIYFIQHRKSLGNFDNEASISESEKDIINLIAEEIDMKTLIIFWQFILKVMEELSIISNPILSIEMLVIRLIHLKDMPSYENIFDSLKKESLIENYENNNKIDDSDGKNFFIKDEKLVDKTSKDQIKNTIQIKPNLSSLNEKETNLIVPKSKIKISCFEDLISLASKKREIQLKYDLEKNVNLIKFIEGKIDISFNQNLDKDFVRNLSARLAEWTGNRWVITLSKKKGEKSFFEKKNIAEKERLNNEKNGEVYKSLKNIFHDAELLEIKKKD